MNAGATPHQSEPASDALFLDHLQEGVAICRVEYEGEEPVDLVYLKVNQAFTRLTGMQAVEGKRITELLPGVRSSDNELLRIYGEIAAGAGPRRFEMYVQALNSHFQVSAYSHEPGHITAIFTIDDDQRRQLEEVRQTRQRLELALKASAMGVWELNITNGEIWWSPECYLVVGVLPDELTLANYQSFIHPDDREAVLRHAMEAAAVGGEYTDEYRLLRKDGTLRWLRNLGQGILDAQGRPHKLIGTVQDVTEHREMEAKLLRTQRLDSMGRLAAGLAHDLNNDLTPILAGAKLLLDDRLTEDQRELLEMMRRSATHGAEMLRSLLAFARGTETPLRQMSLADSVSDIFTLIRQSFPRVIQLSLACPEGLPPVLGDRTQLHQALLNLCINARDAMPGGGRLCLALDTVEVNDQTPGSTPAFQRGTHLRLSVSDSGSGISPEHMEHIFDPFFSTKPVGKGSGLGLPTTLGIVRSHRGFIQVESKPGQGTCFRILIPANAHPQS
jgi:PAS domain S-box-containing protein